MGVILPLTFIVSRGTPAVSPVCLSARDIEAAESCGLGVANVFVVG
ncbi:hypothetical protein PAST3_03789 [Cutibacterium acnes HL201PA1]|nr:hypothetical protein PAST3_03789 [Cutibacterium acnes HL201PA1]